MSQRTAKQAYDEHMTMIEKHLKEIRTELQRHKRAFKQEGNERDWGHVGDVAHIASLLHHAEAFMKNEDIDD